MLECPRGMGLNVDNSGIIVGYSGNPASMTCQTMKLVCAWCRSEGKPGVIGEKPPLDDATETHGICQRHQHEVLETLPSASFPDVELLIVVHPREEALFKYLQDRWARVRGVKVIIDRRRGERRRGGQPAGSERRRRLDGRVRQVTFMPPGYLFVRFKRKRRESA